MILPTAHAAVSIQYPAPICMPIYGVQAIPIRNDWPYAIVLSDFRPETMIMSPSFASIGVPARFISPDLLDWEFSAGTPDREFGTIEVTLEYVGRGLPVDPQGIWD